MLLSTGPPLNFQNTKSHVNCSENSLSARAYKGILYLENLGGGQLKEAPCSKYLLQDICNMHSIHSHIICLYSIYTQEAFLHYPDYKGSLVSPQNSAKAAWKTSSPPTRTWTAPHTSHLVNHDSALDMVASEGRDLHFSYALFLCTFLEHGK